MLIGGGKGVVRTCLADPDVVADYMPVDIAIRAIIIAVWHHSVNRYISLWLLDKQDFVNFLF